MLRFFTGPCCLQNDSDCVTESLTHDTHRTLLLLTYCSFQLGIVLNVLHYFITVNNKQLQKRTSFLLAALNVSNA